MLIIFNIPYLILKDFKGVFKNGTSKHQLKLKIAFTLDVRIVGFIEGTKGTKREKTFAWQSGEIKVV